MHKGGKIVTTMGMLSLLSVMPLPAQVAHSAVSSVVFTAPFPFHAGTVKLPAGSYRITEPNENADIVLIRNSAGTKGEFINFIPTSTSGSQKENRCHLPKNMEILDICRDCRLKVRLRGYNSPGPKRKQRPRL